MYYVVGIELNIIFSVELTYSGQDLSFIMNLLRARSYLLRILYFIHRMKWLIIVY